MDKKKMFPSYWEAVIAAVDELSKSSKTREAIFTIVFDELKKYEDIKEVLSPKQGVVRALNKIKSSMSDEKVEGIAMGIIEAIRSELGKEIDIQKGIGGNPSANPIKSTLNSDDMSEGISSGMKH